ncbi:hypothetical protein EVAR_59685_1 [Eumeta japonica]|uniref:Uncharacterized protein n=1 Tax=Eumeta variegata TaxID=151549 RepID=A0A4C1Z281_EUMVA|nr:hypothetical protein EVAR_59685_1 [Eumeta japonica]
MLKITTYPNTNGKSSIPHKCGSPPGLDRPSGSKGRPRYNNEDRYVSANCKHPFARFELNPVRIRYPGLIRTRGDISHPDAPAHPGTPARRTPPGSARAGRFQLPN